MKDNDDDDDDIIIIEPTTTSSIINEFCQHIDKITNESCKEYYSVVCIHCNLYLCYIHVEIHQILLLNERDQLINELNERINDINQLIENPDKIQKILFEQIEIKTKMKVSFIQQLSTEKLIDLNKIIIELKQLFEPVRTIFKQNQCVSLYQIKKIKECFVKFDENKKLLFNRIIDTIPTKEIETYKPFHLSNITSPCRQYELPVQRSFHNEMAASEDLLIINDREHILLFNLINSLDDNLIPEIIEWKNNLDGKILDIYYSCYLKLFFILTDEKLFSYSRLSSFVFLHRFTSLPWSCATLLNSVYILYKYSTLIEQWVFPPTSSSPIQMIKQWKLNEVIVECEHDQHLRCIRANPDQTHLAILIEDDECRWRIGIFDNNMNCLHQTDTLPNASTIDWNLVFSFISFQQLLIMDATTEQIYLITIDQNTSTIEHKQFTDSDYPVNACIITNNGYSQLILKMVKPNMLKVFQI
ncbi:unnamed protein product [Adineta steineri]|uniref:Uncharacterized protein n=1 Tax=Adineta steineri TaxID=433720 RepID=A0A819JI79_9BILA|nr:unnamed protein product [Adineta steineri]